MARGVLGGGGGLIITNNYTHNVKVLKKIYTLKSLEFEQLITEFGLTNFKAIKPTLCFCFT